MGEQNAKMGGRKEGITRTPQSSASMTMSMSMSMTMRKV